MNSNLLIGTTSLLVAFLVVSSEVITLNSNNTFTGKKVLGSARQYYISSRDSYVNAASSFGGSQSQSGSSKLPQSSYNAPSSQAGYAQQQQGSYGGGSGWGSSGGGGYGDDSQSSKAGGGDLAGLIGLVGLAGLKGTLPVIKKAILIFIALLPILIPLAIIKLPILLLKPVITFGRGTSIGSSVFRRMLFGMEDDDIAKKLGFVEKFNETVVNNITDSDSNWMDGGSQNEIYNDIVDSGMAIGNDILGKDADNRCMQRIACEGLFKSLPRIFLRFMGDNSYALRKPRYTSRVRRSDDKHTSPKPEASETARRKDLATLAVNKLKTSQYLTKARPITQDITNTEDVCKQYKCPELF